MELEVDLLGLLAAEVDEEAAEVVEAHRLLALALVHVEDLVKLRLVLAEGLPGGA